MRRLLAFTLMSALFTAMAGRSQAPKSNDLMKLGGIAAENGEIAILNTLVTAYSSRNIRASAGKLVTFNIVGNDGRPVSYEIKTTGMQRVKDTVPAAVAHEFQLCDSLDQISMPIENGIRALLPKGAKIKSTEKLLDGRILLAYSEPSDEHYRLVLSLVDGTADIGHTTVGEEIISGYGDYCGMQSITKDIRAVLVNEPSGSSDFSAAYFFALRKKETAAKK